MLGKKTLARAGRAFTCAGAACLVALAVFGCNLDKTTATETETETVTNAPQNSVIEHPSSSVTTGGNSKVIVNQGNNNHNVNIGTFMPGNVNVVANTQPTLTTYDIPDGSQSVAVPVESTESTVTYTDGSQAKVQILMVSQLYKWHIRDTEWVENIQTHKPCFTVQQCVDRIHGSLVPGSIICLGMSSQEIEKSPKGEEDRALQRAESLADACRTAMPNRDLWTLNLGLYVNNGEPDSANTNVQRRVVLVVIQGIEGKLSDEKVETGVLAAIQGHEKEFKFPLDKYSLWPKAHVKPA